VQSYEGRFPLQVIGESLLEALLPRNSAAYMEHANAARRNDGVHAMRRRSVYAFTSFGETLERGLVECLEQVPDFFVFRGHVVAA